MTATQMPRRRRAPRSAVTAAAVALLLVTPLTAPAAQADPPGVTEDSAPPVHIDPTDPDLRMVQGAKLAASKVLNIKSIVESDDGSERRQDTNDNVTFALQAEVLFGKDSADLSSDALSRIGTIADEIKKQHATSLRVFGFTDNLGSAGHGLVLSKRRATAVQEELAKDLGPSVGFQIRGYGEQYPIADNTTEEGRKKNRRVEVSFPRAS
ncbi:OmpA family protein [Streptomyces sp. 2333.5]|uniref:OmpA family protein n=1 Tax=unclassified Streptomyces TaxID=2593676 RepID=UPI00089D1371|nr:MULTISPECIES: OmpA family protein [unclassified Streptomyces]PJJ04125.1 OmpA family protein [Streptomyces sp. 2333.5]SEE43217.1 OmpA family protein [Streptomyces sp. 2314.4]SEE68637.1 OmpA family protein [Streptomyces sp. 2112.2]SOE11478.1 OmpA family protein [Streptomyces sp. 2323.1]